MTDMPHIPAATTPAMLTAGLRTVRRVIEQLSQPGRDVSLPNERVRAERHLAAALRREEARRAADRLLR